MTDVERVRSICASFFPILRKFFFTPDSLLWREPLDSLRTRCWYESQKQRYGLSGPAEMERGLEPGAVKYDAAGREKYSTNKWGRFRDGGAISLNTVREVEKNAPGSMRIFQHPLWEVLDFDNGKVMEGEGLLRRLSAELQAVLFEAEQIGLFKYMKRAPVNKKLLKKLELMADLDVLACLTWLLREAAENKCSSVDDIGRSLHKVLTMMALELHDLKVGLPLLKHFIDRVLPLALPRHHRMVSTPLDYICASSLLNLLAFNLKGEPKALDWNRRVKNMLRWLNGKVDFDVQVALGLDTSLDDKYPWIPVKVIESLKASARSRGYGWNRIFGEELNRSCCCRDLIASYIGQRVSFSALHFLKFQPITLEARNSLLHLNVRTSSFCIIKLARFG